MPRLRPGLSFFRPSPAFQNHIQLVYSNSPDRFQEPQPLETALMRRFKAILPLIFLCSAATFMTAQNQNLNTAPDHFDLNSIDKSLDPCTDFYAYSCKKWQEANPIPPDQP